MTGLAAAGMLPRGILEHLGFFNTENPVSTLEGMGEHPDLVTHLLNRFSFGRIPGEYARVLLLASSPEACARAWMAEQLQPAQIADAATERMIRRLEFADQPDGELFEYKEEFLLKQMTAAVVQRAVYSNRQLQEVLTDFWTDHFNISVFKGDCRWLKAADDRRVIRPHALGRFQDLVRASALSPAMLWYLDGRENRGDESRKPNENYARELLELHTLGVHGGYSQDDVMEVARCFTGWTVQGKEAWSRRGKVEFHPERHDDGAKHLLGVTIPAGKGKADVDRVIEILANHPSTARHIAEKFCRRFVAEEPSNEIVNAVAVAFGQSSGSIPDTLRALLAHPDFSTARTPRFKRPFEFVVSALRATNAKTDGGPAIAEALQRMGHSPYQYPTPDGYPHGKQVVDGDTSLEVEFCNCPVREHTQGHTGGSCGSAQAISG